MHTHTQTLAPTCLESLLPLFLVGDSPVRPVLVALQNTMLLLLSPLKILAAQ